MHKADNPTWWKARLHWTERDLHNGRRVGQSNLPAMVHWKQSHKLKTVVLKWLITKGWNLKHRDSTLFPCYNIFLFNIKSLESFLKGKYCGTLNINCCLWLYANPWHHFQILTWKCARKHGMRKIWHSHQPGTFWPFCVCQPL